MPKYFIIYLIFINIFAFIFMFVDKKRAIRNKWRIRESTLITLSIFGGSIGILLGIQSFRHKTKHKKFTIGVPIILIIQISTIIYLFL
ncbi:DUF1294 domain-containing protein [Clostridium paraputrificum]|uniref:DUF1294 domain-containing protein n=1 Tax=Clostridium TaxID=1485 RepID=UPI003D330B2A